MIKVSGIRKDYGSIQALKGISFDVGIGECFGLLGPNGAGKTTAISIISTLLEADQGNVEIDGRELKSNKSYCKQVLGVVPQEIALYNNLSAYDNLMFWGSLYNLKQRELKLKIEDRLKRLGLYERRNDKVKNYSGGMKRRINIAAALLHSPKILLLDEPTVGIDPQSRNLIFEVIETLKAEGLTIIYTTHYMEEAERLCDRIAIIDYGEIIAMGNLQELIAKIEAREIVKIKSENLEEGITEKLKDLTALEFVVSNSTLEFKTQSAKNELSKIVNDCNEAGVMIQQIDIQGINLETVFLTLTGKKLRD
ncbi:ABC transporter ATP-binding protein [Candidatus Amoebophilus asiaticus]|nr:ABC transporter ATP-binding protein [Candidatus Amoebophilus asiaticus]